MRAPFIVFYRYQGQEYNAAFDTMRRAKQFARLTGGRIESRLTNLLEGYKNDWAVNRKAKNPNSQ